MPEEDDERPENYLDINVDEDEQFDDGQDEPLGNKINNFCVLHF